MSYYKEWPVEGDQVVFLKDNWFCKAGTNFTLGKITDEGAFKIELGDVFAHLAPGDRGWRLGDMWDIVDYSIEANE